MQISEQRAKRWELVSLAAVISIHSSMLLWANYRHTPVASEIAHLVAGISHLKLNRYDLLNVNPPLIRSIAALPVVALEPQCDWVQYDSNPLARSEHAVNVILLMRTALRRLNTFTLQEQLAYRSVSWERLTCYFWQEVYMGGRLAFSHSSLVFFAICAGARSSNDNRHTCCSNRCSRRLPLQKSAQSTHLDQYVLDGPDAGPSAIV